MTKPIEILVVEDEKKLAQILLDYLQSQGYVTHWLSDGADVISHIQTNQPSLALLDVMLPEINGFELCSMIREFSQLPIIMVTAAVEEKDRLLGFDLGVDDYICKPFSPKEVVSRVNAVLKRMQAFQSHPDHKDLKLDTDKFRAEFKNKRVDLTALEFRLLMALHQSPGKIFSREELLNKIYPGHHIVSDRTVDSHIRNLRRKLREASPENDIIHSIYGAGYKLEF